VVICRHLVNTMSSTTDEVQKRFCHSLKRFVAIVPILNCLFCEDTARNSRLLNVFEEKIKQGYQLDTVELVELLQQYAAEYMAIFRQMKMRTSDSVFETVPADLKALYAYKRGDYDRCLQLSLFLLESLFALWYDRQKEETLFVPIFAYPEFIQLMDDDIVSLTALTLIVEPSCRDGNYPQHVTITPLCLSLYLQTRCKTNLGRPLTLIDEMLLTCFESLCKETPIRYLTLNSLMLKLLERKLLRLRGLDDSE